LTATLEELRDRAINEAEKTGTLSDIVQAITVAKTVAEERKRSKISPAHDAASVPVKYRSSQVSLQ